MYETGKLAQVILEIICFKTDILGISECRWTGSGRHRTSTGEKVLYSGRGDEHQRQGVA